MRSRILTVDSNQETREVTAVLLENEGYEVEEAGDGETAAAKAEDMDLIALDVMMPKMDGFRACRRIREITNAPTLFLTVKTMDQDKVLESSSGGDDYLARLFSYNELIVHVKALLRRYRIYKGKEEPREGNQIITRDLIISRNSN